MPKMHPGAAAAAAALFLCAFLAGDATAAARFSVEPLLLTLRADRLATSLTLGNDGAKAVTVQAELVSWHQAGGEDVYGEATGMVVSPPIFNLAPGAKQVVRVGRVARGKPPEREQAYRIKLFEVPQQAAERPQALSTYMQLSLPMFVPPADDEAQPALQVQPAAAGGDLRLRISNPGLVHDRITGLELSQDGKALAERSLNYYVLAGVQREFVWAGALKAAKAGTAELRIRLGRKRSLSHTVSVGPAPSPAAPPAAVPPPAESRPSD